MKAGLATAILMCILLCRCAPSPVAGGTTDTGNIRFAAIMYEDEGDFAAQASVTLCHADYLQGINDYAPSQYIRQTFTNDSGLFSFDSLYPGSYSIEVNDRKCSAYRFTVTFGSDDFLDHYDSTYSDTLQSYATVTGNAGVTDASAPRYCQIYGLQRIAPLDSSGNFTFSDLPPGDYQFRIVSADSQLEPVIVDEVSAVSGETTRLPYISWSHSKRLFLNTSASGAHLSRQVTDFPVLVRLDDQNFPFEDASPDGADVRFADHSGNHLPTQTEMWDRGAGRAILWVRVDTIRAQDSTQFISMYWGNTAAEHNTSSAMVFDTAAGFQGVWHLTGVQSGQTPDATANNFDGTVNAADSTPGIIGPGVLFADTTGYISIPGSAQGALNFPENGNYTLSAWIYVNAFPVDHYIVGKGNYQYHLKIKEEQWHFSHCGTDWEYTNSPAELNSWQHVTGVRNGDKQYLYVNGTCVDSTIETLSGEMDTTTLYEVEFGRRSDSLREYSQPFYGKLDEIRLSNRARSSSWVRLTYINQYEPDRLVQFK